MRKVIALMVLASFLSSVAFASVAVKEDGVYVGEAVAVDFRNLPQGSTTSTSGSDIRVDMNYGAGTVTTIADADTPYVITASENGMLFVLTSATAGGKVVTLPSISAVSDGFWVEISANQQGISKDGSVDGDGYIVLVRPADSSDTLIYTDRLTPGADDEIGKGVMSTGTDSYPTLKVIVSNSEWLVTGVKGSFTSER